MECVANSCNNKPSKDLEFFSFPDCAEQRKKWIEALQKPVGWIPPEGARVCSVHFVSRQVNPHPWHPDYAPSVFRRLRTKQRCETGRRTSDSDSHKKQKFIGQAVEDESELALTSTPSGLFKKKRPSDFSSSNIGKTQVKLFLDNNDTDIIEDDSESVQSTLFDSHDDESSVVEQPIIDIPAEIPKPRRGGFRGRPRGRGRGRGSSYARTSIRDTSPTDTLSSAGFASDAIKCENCQVYLQEIASLAEELASKRAIVAKWNSIINDQVKVYYSELQTYKAEVKSLQTKLATLQLSEEFFKKKKTRVIMYTGLPNFSVLITLFNLVKVVVPNDSIYKITVFQRFILVLMRLRMNLKFKDLAYRFNVDLVKIERFFPKWIDAMYNQFSHVLLWPHEKVQENLSLLSKSVSTKYSVIKGVIPISKFLTQDGKLRTNHKIDLVCAALTHISNISTSEFQDQLPDVLASKEDISEGYMKFYQNLIQPVPAANNEMMDISFTQLLKESNAQLPKISEPMETDALGTNQMENTSEFDAVNSGLQLPLYQSQTTNNDGLINQLQSSPVNMMDTNHSDASVDASVGAVVGEAVSKSPLRDCATSEAVVSGNSTSDVPVSEQPQSDTTEDIIPISPLKPLETSEMLRADGLGEASTDKEKSTILSSPLIDGKNVAANDNDSGQFPKSTDFSTLSDIEDMVSSVPGLDTKRDSETCQDLSENETDKHLLTTDDIATSALLEAASSSDLTADVATLIDTTASLGLTTSGVTTASSLPQDPLVFSNTDVRSVAADILSQLMGSSHTEGSADLLSVGNVFNNPDSVPIADHLPLANQLLDDAAKDQSMDEMASLEKLHLECQSVHEDFLEYSEFLTKRMAYHIKINSLSMFNNVAKLYTGSDNINLVSSDVLPYQQQCWIALSKLKLDIDDVDFAYSYSLPVKIIESVIKSWIELLSCEFAKNAVGCSASNEQLMKSFAILQNLGDEDDDDDTDNSKMWDSCRFIEIKCKEAESSSDTRPSFSEVWSRVGPEFSAVELQSQLMAQLHEIQSISIKRPILSMELLENSTDKFVMYYTGFTDFDSLRDVYNMLLPGPEINASKTKYLDCFSQIMCVFLRLARNFSRDEILQRINIYRDASDAVPDDGCDVDVIITSWLPWIHSRLMLFVTFPETQKESNAFLDLLKERYTYLKHVSSPLRLQGEAVCAALFNAGHHLYCITSDEEQDWAEQDELVDWLF